MSSSLNGNATGGGASLPATPAQALLDAAAPQTFVVLDGAGVGEALSPDLVAPMMLTSTLALRRPAGSSALLWECTESASPLASTGSVACSLSDAGAAVIGYHESLSTMPGTSLHCTAAATSEVVGGAGVYPASATITAVTMWAWVVLHVLPTGFAASMSVCRDYNLTGSPWAPPYGNAVMIRAGGVVTAAGVFGTVPTYDEVSSGSGAVETYRQHLVGLTYDGTNLRVWVDGKRVGSKSVATPLTWGALGSWHLGGSGNVGGGNDLLNGVVVRAGVDTTVWTQAQWADAYRVGVGNAP